MKQPTLEERVAALEKHVVQLIVRCPPDADAEELMAMSQPALEERVAALEKHVVQLLARLPPLAQPLDWRSTVGMFANDEVMKQIEAEGRKIREQIVGGPRESWMPLTRSGARPIVNG